jgi:hypothetical protein
MSTALRQRGQGLIALLLVLTIGASWFLVSRLDAISGDLAPQRRTHNAAALAEAKQALIGYVARKAAETSQNEPGALPCPEAAGSAGTASTEGTPAPNLALPAVGRLPWKTLGIDRLVDASGEPLWYAVANGWGNCAAAQTVINSNCTSSASMTCYTGQFTVNGRPRAAVALIIAPGPALAAANAGCGTTRNQLDPVNGRKAPAAGIDPANYVECYSGASFATTGASGSYNDQVVLVTAEELLPAIEAAVADRFERQIAPQLRTAYSAAPWSSGAALPFAVPFGDPSATPANRFEGSATPGSRGLLPVNYAFDGACTCASPPCVCTMNACTTGSDARCDPSFVAWGGATISQASGGGSLQSYSCSASGTPSTLTCTLDTYVDLATLLFGDGRITLNIDAKANNVGMALRKINLPSSGQAPAITGIDTSYLYSPIGYDITSATLDGAGAATLRINARLPATSGNILAILGGLTCNVLGIPLCYRHTITIPMGLLGDHPLVDPTDSTYSWFTRNKWHEASYYAVAAGLLPGGGGSCTTGTSCLQVAYDPDSGKQRALVILSGRSLSNTPRPNGTLGDWLEGDNADGASPFAIRDPSMYPNRSFNDRIAVIDSN